MVPFNFYEPIPHDADCLHTATPLPRHRPPHPSGIAIRKLKIRDGQGFRLVQAIWVVERGDFDVMILTETKISTTTYCQNRLRYKATFLMARASSAWGAQGGVRTVKRKRPIGWGIDGNYPFYIKTE